MEIKIYKPRSPLLLAHIDCFYSLVRSAGEPPATYLTFPGLQQAVCLYADTASTITDDLVAITHEPNGKLESRIVGKFQQPVCVQYEGQINEITTLFKPLAINAFLPRPLKEIAPGHFPAFDPYPDFMPAMEKIHNTADIAEKLETLEAYWLGKYHGFRHPFLPAVIAELTNEEGKERSFTAICTTHGISRQTLHKHFGQYLCKTPAVFRKVVRFRRAMKNYQRKAPHGLSRLSAWASYFDQSHMIHDFKSLTGHTPANFFRRISRLGNGEINFMFRNGAGVEPEVPGALPIKK